jgi:hypothetical protein
MSYFTISLKDKKLAKNPAVKKWLREVTKKIEKEIEEREFNKMAYGVECNNEGLKFIKPELDRINLNKYDK